MTKRLAIVTGAGTSNGIGAAIAQQLVQNDFKVFIADINLAAASEVANKIAQTGGEIEAFALDVTNQRNVKEKIKSIVDAHGPISVLVNNAGITRPTRVLEISDEEFDLIFSVNMKGTFYMTQAVLPSMVEQNYGRIINLGSVSAKRGGGVFGGSHYSAAKGAVMSFTKAVAREMASQGITVNSVAPGFIGTGITGDFANNPDNVKMLLETIPANRIGTVEDVAHAVCFLASEHSGYITGEEIDINGGSHID